MKEKLKDIKFKLNGKEIEIAVNPKTLLLELLREELKLTGTRTGCEVSACGACTVNLDGKAVRACSILAVQVNGHEVVTIEGGADGEKLHPIQEAMVNHGAIECGFCTSGMLMSVKGLLQEKKKPTTEEIKESIDGNMCRCTGYTKIVDAIESLFANR